LFLDLTNAAARFAGMTYDASLSPAFGAGALDGEEALGGAHFAVAAAGAAGLRLGARLRAGALAFAASDRRGNADFGTLAAIGVFERDFHVVAQVAAAIGPASAALPAAHEFAEQIVEHIGERRGEVESARPTSAHAVFKGSMTKPVVGRALIGILQDFVGL